MGGDEVGPDPSMFDEHGCVRRELLGTTCNGLRPVNGPNFDGKECCYDVCHMPVPCGRPLIVRDEARVAPAARRADWCAELSGEVRATSVTLRDALRRAWLADAALEHASVASFARFSLELMAVGAPAALVAGAHAAALDEVEHARACYALAAAYGDERAEGARVGPGAMALDGLSLRIALLEVATAAVVEGCVGETIAACAALRAREFCADPVVAAVLERIAADELVHAELSYRFVAWALGKLGVGARPALRAAFERGLRQLEASEGPRPDELAAYRAAGRLDGDAFARVVRTARSEIVEPCMRALLDGSARAVVAEGVHASA